MKQHMAIITTISKHRPLKALPILMLLILSPFSQTAALVSTLIFTLFVPGYLIVESYFDNVRLASFLIKVFPGSAIT